MKPAMYARLQVSRADMGIGITSEEQHLEEQHANGPHTRTAAIPWQDEFSDQGLDLEQKKRAEKNSQAGQRSGSALVIGFRGSAIARPFRVWNRLRITVLLGQIVQKQLPLRHNSSPSDHLVDLSSPRRR